MTISKNTLCIDGVYKFTMRAPSILGATLNGWKVIGMVSWDAIAGNISIDLATRHSSIVIDVNNTMLVPINPANCKWVMISKDSVIEYIAFEYIESFTSDVGYVVTITGVVDTDLEVNALRQLLSSNGYKDFQLTTTGK